MDSRGSCPIEKVGESPFDLPDREILIEKLPDQARKQPFFIYLGKTCPGITQLIQGTN